MTRDDIIRMIKKAGGILWQDSCELDFSELERFAALVAAAEREACAKVLEENAKACVKDSLMYKVLMSNAMAIRARGEKP